MPRLVGTLIERLAYYACNMFVEQVPRGGSDASVSPSISICLLKNILFPNFAQAHQQFAMRDRESGRKLDNAIDVHTVELTKYKLEEETIFQANKLGQWAFLLVKAQDYDAATLKRLLPGIEFETAFETIEIISKKTEDKQMYDQLGKSHGLRHGQIAAVLTGTVEKRNFKTNASGYQKQSICTIDRGPIR